MSMKKIVQRAVSKVRHAGMVTRIIDYESRWQAQVVKRYGCGNGLPTIDIAELVPGLSETLDPYSFLEGVASPIDMAMLMGLARQLPHCAYLEIGSLRGESAANLAKVAEHGVSVSLSVAEMQALGYSSELVAAHHFYSRGLANVELIEHNSQTLDFTTLNRSFDLIFIDGDHYHESVKRDTQNAFRVLRNDDAIIVWHDYGFSAGDIRWSVLAGILAGAPLAAREQIYHVSNTMCAIYSKRKFTSTTARPWQTPRAGFAIQLAMTAGGTVPQ
jgi:predicted O-methyltransferase YrrM